MDTSWCFSPAKSASCEQYRSRSARISYKEIGFVVVVEPKTGLGRCMCHYFDPLSDSFLATSSSEQVMYEGL
jgi:hypothetical protein